MGERMNHEAVATNDGEYSVLELRQLYTETVEELQRFSQMNPSEVVDDAEVDTAETALLDFEDYLLERASRIPLQTEDDISALMDVWAKVSASTDNDSHQSDKIVRNIFRHLG